MPCNHHHFHHNPCCCCCNSCTNPSNHQHDQQQQQQEQLLQALTSLFYQPSPSPVLQIPTIYSSQFLKPQQSHHNLHQQQQQTVIQSLLQRIAALESSAQPLNPDFSQYYPQNQQKQRKEQTGKVKARPFGSPETVASPPAILRRPSLRDLAARTIQAAFRRFLVRRSRTLRDLKDLAFIKSQVAALKPVLSIDKAGGHDPHDLSRTAMDLLLRLDSIGSVDVMIREGKRSISRELVRILEFVDKVLLKEHQQGIEFEENDKDQHLIRREVERSSDGARVRAKKVSFLDSMKGLSNSLFDESNDNAGDRNGYVDRLEEEFVGMHVRDHPEPEEVHNVSEDEKSSEDSMVENGGRYVNGGSLEMHGRKRGLSAPRPVRMESRKS